LDSYFFPGGFLYSLPLGIPEPITTCENPSLEAKIGVEAWASFSEPRFDGLRLHPPGGQLGGNRPVTGPTNEMLEDLKARGKGVLRSVDAWVESQVGSQVKSQVESERGPEKNQSSDEHSETKTYHDGDKGRTAHHAVEDDDSTVTCTPPRKMALVKSLELLRRVSGATRTVEDNSTSSKTAQSPGAKSENRFTVIMDRSESDSGSDSESGAEEWESVLSEFESQG